MTAGAPRARAPDIPAENGGAACYSADAELAVLGGMLIDADALAKAVKIVDHSMFYQEGNRRLFRTMVSLWERGEVIDPVTLSDALKTGGELEIVGGLPFLAQLFSAVPTAANIEYHARIVRQKALHRRFLQFGLQLPLLVNQGEAGITLAVEGMDAMRSEWDAARGSPISRFRLLTGKDLDDLRDPEWQVDGMIPAGGLVVVYGPPGAGKSFFVLAIVLAIVHGIPFHGMPVKSGAGLYVITEGHSGIKGRRRAWRTANAVVEDGPMYFHADAVNLLDPAAVGEMLAALKALGIQIAVTVFDTFARCMPGGDENSARDVGLAIEQADRIRKELGSTVILVHHTNVNGERERGSTALRGAADTMIQVKSDDDVISVVCDKQKEAEPFAKLALRLQSIAESCVLQPANECDGNTLNLPTATEREALACLAGSFLEDGATFTEWQKASSIPERSFYRTRTALVEKGYVITDGAKRGARYTVSNRGRAALPANLPIPANNLPGSEKPLPANLPHSFRSGRYGSNGSAALEAHQADDLEEALS